MTVHKPVLLKEAIELLNLKENSVVVDATLGGGGHSREILKRIGTKGILIAFDLDSRAIESFAKFPSSNFQFSNKFQFPNFKIRNAGNIYLVEGNFTDLKNILKELKIEKVDAVLADLGWSSDQLAGKGLSFQTDEKLDMRLEATQEISAREIVNEYSEEELAKIIREYGEEKFWKNIAQKIIEFRKNKKIETTGELAEIIKSVMPAKYRFGKIHPATRTFQALRIEVNRELENLKSFIPQAVTALDSGGRLAIISFHSLEDRIVKKKFAEDARGSISTDVITGQKKIISAPVIRLVTKKPVAPAAAEVADNPRARSAKLRVCEKL